MHWGLTTRADLGVLLGLKHPPPKFYHEQAIYRKLLEAVVQVQLYTENLKRVRGIINASITNISSK